jgi:hypothetical protein
MDTFEIKAQARSISHVALCALVMGLASWGCDGRIGDWNDDPAHPTGSTGVGTGGVGSGGVGSTGSGTTGGTTGGAGGGPNEVCTTTPPVAARMVRLSFGQVANTLLADLGPNALMGVSLDNPHLRAFQALFDEGDLLNTAVLQKTVSWTESAIATVADPAKFTQLTGCASPVTDACASAYINTFAQKAYRRPLTTDESASLAQLYADLKTGGSPIDEAARYAMEAALVSPQALYRTEFGKPGGLSDDEVASQLSYFLTNGPPDAPLLDAVKSGKLSSSDGVGAEVDRLLKTDAAIQNMNQTMMAYYLVGQIDSVVKDPMVFPDFTIALRNSMYGATQKFIGNHLWNGKVGEMLTANTFYVDENIAKLYGITYPGASGSGFLPYQFADGQRTGILAEPSILSIRARTDNTSVVSRGLYVNSNVLCNQTPPPPPASVAQQVAAQKADVNSTERQKSDFRRTTAPCNGCHGGFDQYGLVLETYDGIGRYRTMYPGNVPIDTSVTLPDFAGGGMVADVAEFAAKEASNGVFSRCLTTNMMKYALAEGPVDATDCSVKDVHDKFLTTDQSFASLLREIALSKTLSVRGPGQ